MRGHPFVFGLTLIWVATLLGASAPPLRPPMNLPPVLVASFGEYRPDHLHPGIDLSTSGATGLPVFAVAQGEIYRLKVEWRGYGRAIYLKHADGVVSVYAHLERFEEAKLGLETRVAQAQRTTRSRYPGDIYLDPPVQVSRGQQIAFSGESGAGLPHLHFEIRKGEQRPADPSSVLPGLPPAPAARPEALILLAEKAGTLVQGARTAEVSLRRGPDGSYVPAAAIVATGPFIPEIRIVSEDASGHRLGVAGLSTRLDGKLVYQAWVREFTFDQYPQVGLLMDHSRSRLSPSAFTYRLKRLPGNTLGLPAHPPEAPWPELSPGRHRLEVEVKGPKRSVTLARIPFEIVESPAAVWKQESRTDSASFPLTLEFPSRSGTTASFQVLYSPVGKSDPLACRSRRPFPGGETCTFTGLEKEKGITATWLAQGVPVGRSTHWLRGGEAEDAGPMRVNPGIGFVDLELPVPPGNAPGPSQLVLYDTEGESALDFSESPPGILSVSIPIERWARATRMEALWSGDGAPRRQSVALTPHVARPDESLRLEDCGLSAEFPAGAFFSITAIACSRDSDDVSETKDLRLRSSIVRLLPAGTPLSRKATLTFPVPQGVPPRSLAIYRLDPVRKEWIYFGGDASPSGISTAVGRLDTFALLEDHAPPEILGIEPAPGAGLSRTPRFVVRVRDEGSGLSYDGLHLALDGAELEMEFDPDRGWSTGAVKTPLSTGNHVLSVWAEDRSGNRTPGADSTVQVR